MNVLVLSHMFPSERDPAAGIFVLEQLKWLQKSGVSVLVFSPTPWAPRWLGCFYMVRKHLGVPYRSTVEGITVERPRIPTLPRRIGFAALGLQYYLGCRSLLERYLRHQPLSLIHAHAILPDGLAAVLLGREFHIPTICTLHGSDISVFPHHSATVYRATAWALRRADRLIAVSDDLRRKTLAICGPRQIAVARNGADHDAFKVVSRTQARRMLGLPVDSKIVCSVGYLRPEKSLDTLLKAIACVRCHEAVVCIVGDGPMKPSLASCASELGIQNRCMFVGQQPHASIPLWLSAADCFVLCSLTEGLPTVLPEAMLCQIPIVATPAGGIPEVIHSGHTGVLVPFLDPAALANALENLFDRPEYAATLAQHAFRFATTELTWEANARATVEVYNDALSFNTRACTTASAAVRDGF